MMVSDKSDFDATANDIVWLPGKVTFAYGNISHLKNFLGGKRLRRWTASQSRPSRLEAPDINFLLDRAETFTLEMVDGPLGDRLQAIAAALFLQASFCSRLGLSVPTLNEVALLVDGDLDGCQKARVREIAGNANVAKHYGMVVDELKTQKR